MPEEILKIILLNRLMELLKETPLPEEKKLEVLERYIAVMREEIKD